MLSWLKSTWRCVVAVLAVAGGGVRAHGYLARPAARNVQRNSDYCPQCLNGGGAWRVFAAGPPGRHGACGDPWDAAPRRHEKGPFATAATYARGQAFSAEVVLTANHGGRWGLKLCRRRSRTGQACFDEHVLRRADGGGAWTRVTPGKDRYVARYRLPRGVACSRCVLQWTYETANSCDLRGGVRTGMPPCESSPNWERFWNCADLTVT